MMTPLNRTIAMVAKQSLDISAALEAARARGASAEDVRQLESVKAQLRHTLIEMRRLRGDVIFQQAAPLRLVS